MTGRRIKWLCPKTEKLYLTFTSTFLKTMIAFFLIFAMSRSFQNLYSQAKTTDSTSKSSISMPEMPSVSMPSVGSGFYSPGRSDFYNPNLNRPQQQNATSAKSQTQEANSPSASETQTAALTTTKNLNSLANSVSSSLNKLSAEDISSMKNLGAFSQISSLLGHGSANLEESLLASQNTVTAQTADSATLQKILSELTSLKNQLNSASSSEGQNSSSPSATLSDISNGQTVFSNMSKKEPKILRFVVNGYDLLATCKKIYFSDLETDGTFLLTGDRKYISENKTRSETFYFYFRANGTDNGITKYAVTPAVGQDYENEYSYLYQLTQKSELFADRTGNLVTLRATDGDWKMDLLLSLEK